MIDVSTCSPEMERLQPYSAIMTAVLRYTQHHHRASAHKLSCIPSTHWTHPVHAYHQWSHTGRNQFSISSTYWTQPVLHIINTLDTTSPTCHHTLDTTSPAYHQYTGHNQSYISSTHWTQLVLHIITHWTQPDLHIINTLYTISPAYHHTLDTTSPAYHKTS